MSEPESTRERELVAVVEAVRKYGEAHPGVVEQAWIEDQPRRVVALLGRNDVATHQRALRALVSVPEHLEIRRSPWPPGHLERIREEIVEAAPDSIRGVGVSTGVLNVELWANQVDMASLLHQRYGRAIVLTVGCLPYPDIESGHRDHVFDQEPPDLPALPPEVSLSLGGVLRISSGAHVQGTLTIRNDGALGLVAGKLVPPVVDPRSGRLVGGYEGAVTSELRRYRVSARASAQVPILIGTASSRPELGWAVPPGRWAIRIPLQLGEEAFQRLLPIEIVA